MKFKKYQNGKMYFSTDQKKEFREIENTDMYGLLNGGEHPIYIDVQEFKIKRPNWSLLKRVNQLPDDWQNSRWFRSVSGAAVVQYADGIQEYRYSSYDLKKKLLRLN